MSLETALDDLRKKLTHVSVTEELKRSEKGKYFLIISDQKQTNFVTFHRDTRLFILNDLYNRLWCGILPAFG